MPASHYSPRPGVPNPPQGARPAASRSAGGVPPRRMVAQKLASPEMDSAVPPTLPPDPPRPLHSPSGIGVVDKSVMIMDALEAGPASLAQLVECTGLARPTVHRLASALVHHRFLSRDVRGRYVIGSRLAELASAAGDDRLVTAAGPILLRLRDATGESSQLYRRQGDARVCVASAERPIGLRDSIPVGTQLSMKAGSAAQVLLAWEDHERLVEGLQGARFTPTVLAGVRRRGWGESLGEREAGVASVSAPVRGPSGRVIAAVSISGPIERLTRQPGRQYAGVVVQAAHQLTELVRKNPDAAEHGLGEQ